MATSHGLADELTTHSEQQQSLDLPARPEIRQPVRRRAIGVRRTGCGMVVTAGKGQTVTVQRRRPIAVGRREPPTVGPVSGDPAAGEHEPAAVPEAIDQALLAEVARGGTAAFERLYDRYAAAVYGMAQAVLHNPSQSEEVAQEVLVEVWRTAARYDPTRGSVRAWILIMARRRAIDRVRSTQAADARDQRAAASATTPAFDDVSETVEIRMQQLQVRRCLDGLSPRQRECIDLAFYRGFSHREVSERLALPLGTVKTRLRDGLILLRNCLGLA
jgi:RNA polymerase sigma-70 factor, ECF subfamily